MFDNFDNIEDFDEFLKQVQKDIACCKALQGWVQYVAIIRPLIEGARKNVDPDTDVIQNTFVSKSMMKSLHEKGVELSLDEAQVMAEAFNHVVKALDILHDNYENWSEKGAILQENKDKEEDLPYFGW